MYNIQTITFQVWHDGWHWLQMHDEWFTRYTVYWTVYAEWVMGPFLGYYHSQYILESRYRFIIMILIQ